MMARYKKRSDKLYQRQVELDRDPMTGKRRRKTVYAKTEAEAAEKAAELKRQHKNGTYVEDSTMKVCEWANQWLETFKRPNVGEHTYQDYKNIINNHFGLIGNVPLQKLTLLQVQAGMNELEGHTRLQQFYRLTIRHVLDAAIDNNLLMKNVASRLPAIQSDTPEKRALTKKELDAIQKTEFTEREKAFVYLALYTGCRRGEIIALQRKEEDDHDRAGGGVGEEPDEDQGSEVQGRLPDAAHPGSSLSGAAGILQGPRAGGSSVHDFRRSRHEQDLLHEDVGADLYQDQRCDGRQTPL
jgi:hypothetical protein